LTLLSGPDNRQKQKPAPDPVLLLPADFLPRDTVLRDASFLQKGRTLRDLTSQKLTTPNDTLIVS
jgi:hypothetical protein